MKNIKRNICIDDIKVGNAVDFYDNGLRTDLVERVYKKKKNKCHVIHTKNYGKISFDKITELYLYDGKKLTKKPILGDLFG